MELEKNSKLPFLDILMDHNNSEQLATSVYHKDTFTGLLTNFSHFIPFCHKSGLIHTSIDQIYKINYTWAGFHFDIWKLICILKKNSYPCPFFERIMDDIFVT